MRIHYHDHFRPCHDVVFSVLFGKRNLFGRLCSAVTGETVELQGEPHTQATLREDDVMLNAIRFDTFASAFNFPFCENFFILIVWVCDGVQSSISIVSNKFFCCSSDKYNISTAGRKAILHSSTISKISSNNSVRRIYL